MTGPDAGIAVLGGTFDPVHFGHLRSAVEVREALQVERIKLIPSYLPPHRLEPLVRPQDRLAMLRLAVAGNRAIEVDDREIRREGRSFTVDTLRSIRQETGAAASLTMVLGYDAFVLLTSWKDWHQLTDQAHILVLDRPGAGSESISMELADFMQGKLVNDPLRLRGESNGLICRLALTQLEISSSRVREILRAGRSPDYLMPAEVIAYVRQHGLYGCASSTPDLGER